MGDASGEDKFENLRTGILRLGDGKRKCFLTNDSLILTKINRDAEDQYVTTTPPPSQHPPPPPPAPCCCCCLLCLP